MRKAFTLIELMVVIGILLVLIGVTVIGLSQIGENQKTKTTQHVLEGLVSMHEEFKAKTNLRDINSIIETGSTPGGIRRTIACDPQAVYQDDSVVRTAKLMQRMLSIPGNKTIMQQLPADRFANTVPAGFTASNDLVDPKDKKKLKVPLPLDAWGNPIVYVPPPNVDPANKVAWEERYGFDGVTLKQGGTHVILNPRQGYPKKDDYLMLQTFRPFWVSAGPDGDFTKGDDNVYSFEN
jgi:prepilin-type N-terminal cleavage/methylation domain-containing protein